MRITRPLEKLKASELAWLYVHVAWPWTWKKKGGNTLLRNEWIMKKDVNEFGKQIESKAMGKVMKAPCWERMGCQRVSG